MLGDPYVFLLVCNAAHFPALIVHGQAVAVIVRVIKFPGQTEGRVGRKLFVPDLRNVVGLRPFQVVCLDRPESIIDLNLQTAGAETLGQGSRLTVQECFHIGGVPQLRLRSLPQKVRHGVLYFLLRLFVFSYCQFFRVKNMQCKGILQICIPCRRIRNIRVGLQLLDPAVFVG